MICVEFDQAGVINSTTDTIQTCTGYVLLSANEYQEYLMLNSLFQIPSSQDLADFFGLIYATILISYFLAFMIGKIYSMIKKA